MLDWLIAVGVANLFTHGTTLKTAVLRQAIFFAQITVMTYLTQSSIGQSLFNIKVVDYQSNDRLAPKRLLMRCVLVSLIIPLFFTVEGRAWPDLVGRSQVVKKISA